MDDNGLATAVSVGTTQITAAMDGVSSTPVTLEVTDGSTLEIHVVDADTREPVAGAEVYLGTDQVSTYIADDQGNVTVMADDDALSGPQTVTAYHPDYFHATLIEVKSRRVVVPLRSKATLDYGEFTGCVDFGEMKETSDYSQLSDILIGLMTRSFFGNPLSLDPNSIIGTFRKVDVCGYVMDIPMNIVGEAACADIPDFAVPGPPGTYGAYMLAGVVNLDDLFQWLADDPNLFYNLGKMLMLFPDMYNFSYSYTEDVVIDPDITPPPPGPNGDPCANQDFVVSPSGKTDYPLLVKVPSLPSGISAEYPPIVFAIADMGDAGFLPIGVNGANGGTVANVYHAQEFLARPLYAMVLASENGVGYEGAYVAVMGQKTSEDDPVMLPDFLDLIQPASFSLQDETYSFYPVADTGVYRTVMTYRFRQPTNTTIKETLYWDLYQPPDLTTTVLPSIPTAPEALMPGWELYQRDWEFFSYDTGAYSFDVLTMDPNLTIYDATVILERISRNKKYHIENG